MKRILGLLFIPLIMAMLSSFSIDVQQKKEVSNKDSTLISVQFQPAKIVVSDERQMAAATAITSYVNTNNVSNLKIAEELSNFNKNFNNLLQERREVSVMDKIKQKYNMSDKDVKSLLKKKKVFNIVTTSVTLIILLLLFVGCIQALQSKLYWNVQGVIGTLLLYASVYLVLLLFIKQLDNLVNYQYYLTVFKVLNSP